MSAVMVCGFICVALIALLVVGLAVELRANGGAILAALTLDPDRIEAVHGRGPERVSRAEARSPRFVSAH